MSQLTSQLCKHGRNDYFERCRECEADDRLRMLTTPPGKLKRVIAELMTRDEPAFIDRRVENFLRDLKAAGYKIVET